MAWETYAPRSHSEVPEDRMVVNKTGYLNVRSIDLVGIGVKDICVLQYDKNLGLIGLMTLSDGMPTVKIKYNKSKNMGTINIQAVLQRLGLKKGSVHGSFDIMRKPGALIINIKDNSRAWKEDAKRSREELRKKADSPAHSIPLRHESTPKMTAIQRAAHLQKTNAQRFKKDSLDETL